MKAFILAGGFATRLWPLTESRAKPLLFLDGKTILAHILDKIPESIEVYLLTNKKFELDFQTEIKRLKRKNIKIFCEDAHSDGEKLGALGAISVALDFFKVKDDLLILAGDNLLPDLDIENLSGAHNEACMAVREVDSLYEAQKFGVVEAKENIKNKKSKVLNFEEKPENPKTKLVSTGFLFMGKDLFPILHDFAKKSPDALGGIFSELLEQNKTVNALPVSGEWFDIGSFDSYLEAHKSLQSKPVIIEKNTKTLSNKYLGKVLIGEGCVIRNSILVDSIIYPGCILENCYISNTIIDEDCHFKHLDLNQKLIRKNTHLNGENQ